MTAHNAIASFYFPLHFLTRIFVPKITSQRTFFSQAKLIELQPEAVERNNYGAELSIKKRSLRHSFADPEPQSCQPTSAPITLARIWKGVGVRYATLLRFLLPIFDDACDAGTDRWIRVWASLSLMITTGDEPPFAALAQYNDSEDLRLLLYDSLI